MNQSASELFIVDNSDSEWKVRNYLTEWCELSSSIDVATGYFEIGALLALKDKWKQMDSMRLLMGDEVSKRTKRAFEEGLRKIASTLVASIESEKKANDFLSGVPAVVEALRSGKIQCRVYRKDKFHAKCYLTHARQAVIGSFGLVGSSNFTKPGLEDNVELNVQIRGNDVKLLQEWHERHWDESEDIRCLPESPIHHSLDRGGLSKLREKLEKQLINSHLKPLQAPVGVSPVLKCWMEIS